MWAQELVKAVAWRVLPSPVLRQVQRRHSFRLVASGRVREPELAALGRFVEPGAYVVDVGANIGLYTKALAERVGSSGRVYSIEPIPETFDLLTSNVARLGLGNVVAMRYAVSDSDGERARLVVPSDRLLGLENPYRARIATEPVEGREVIAETRTLDQLFADEIAHVSFVKCDVEGHELACLRGAVHLMRRDHPTWLLEVPGDPRAAGSTAGEVFQFMRALGYRAYVVDESEPRPWRADEAPRGNYFFVSGAT